VPNLEGKIEINAHSIFAATKTQNNVRGFTVTASLATNHSANRNPKKLTSMADGHK
jgi:hypothetical protein